jgi:hypothetical protein
LKELEQLMEAAVVTCYAELPIVQEAWFAVSFEDSAIQQKVRQQLHHLVHS